MSIRVTFPATTRDGRKVSVQVTNSTTMQSGRVISDTVSPADFAELSAEEKREFVFLNSSNPITGASVQLAGQVVQMLVQPTLTGEVVYTSTRTFDFGQNAFLGSNAASTIDAIILGEEAGSVDADISSARWQIKVLDDSGAVANRSINYAGLPLERNAATVESANYLGAVYQAVGGYSEGSIPGIDSASLVASTRYGPELE